MTIQFGVGKEGRQWIARNKPRAYLAVSCKDNHQNRLLYR